MSLVHYANNMVKRFNRGSLGANGVAYAAIRGLKEIARRQRVVAPLSSRRVAYRRRSGRVVPYKKPTKFGKYGRSYKRPRRSYRARKAVNRKRRLTKTIKDVALHNGSKGHLKEIWYDTVFPLDNLQAVRMVPLTTYCSVTNSGPPSLKYGTWWSTPQIIDGVSTLFNGKIPTYQKFAVQTGNFDTENLKVHIKSSSVTYNLKNNSQRFYVLKVYICKPKNMQFQDGYDPSSLWSETLNNLKCTVLGDGTGINASNSGYNQLYISPGELDGFNAMYSYTVKEYKLPPAGTASFVVAGPKDENVSLDRLYQGGVMSNINKYSRQVMFVLYEDLQPVYSATVPVGTYAMRPLLYQDDLNSCIAVEMVYDFKCFAPDLTREGYDHDAFFYKNYYQTTVTAAEKKIAPIIVSSQQPATINSSAHG